MAAPRTVIELVDNSQIQVIDNTPEVAPITLCAFYSTKGTEELKLCKSLGEFNKEYGSPADNTTTGKQYKFASKLIEKGSYALCKRVVPTDAKWSNCTISFKLNGGGTKAELMKYKFAATQAAIANLGDKNANLPVFPTLGSEPFPFFRFVPKGRGSLSVYVTLTTNDLEEYVKVNPDGSTLADTMSQTYTLNVTNKNDEVLEQFVVSLDPNRTKGTQLIYLPVVVNNYSNYINVIDLVDQDAVFAKLSSYIATIVKPEDLKTAKPGEITSTDSVYLKELFYKMNRIDGALKFDVKNGLTGTFDENTASSYDMYTTFWNGSNPADGDIYNKDKYKVAFIMDADYPTDAKKAICSLVNFRKDCMFFMSTPVVTADKCNSLEAVKQYAATNLPRSPYVAFYPQTYALATGTQETMPITWALCDHIVSIYNNRINAPLCGIRYGMYCDGSDVMSFNFIPRRTPSRDDKTELDKLKFNYVGLYDNRPVFETQYTQNPGNSQLSYISNVLTVQKLARSIRTLCPAVRYAFMDGDDFDLYKDNVQRVINRYVDLFKTIEFVYLADKDMENNKIFYAAINVTFRGYYQSEYFIIEVVK